MAFCSACGASMEEGVKFCSTCGQAADGAAPQASAPPPPSGAAAGGSAEVANQNLMAGLAYLLIPAILFLVIEPFSKNRFIRFHSFQSIFFCIASIVVQLAFGILSGILGFLAIVLVPVGILLSLGLFVLWVYCLLQAFQGKEYRIPFVGDYAANQV